MKRFSLMLLATLSLGLSLSAQDTTIRTRTIPSIGGGLLGGGNYSRFKITDRGSTNIEGNWKWGYVAGAYLNFPLSNGFSIEPQVLYSSVGGKVDLNNNRILDQQLNYLSIPLFFKFHFGEVLALAVGPQFDFRTGAKDRENDVTNEGAFDVNSISATGGFELFPRARVTLYGRYSHGLTKVLNDDLNENAPYYYNQGFQAGLKFKLFGNKRPAKPAPVVVVVVPPADTDGDGVMDSVDKCPAVFGFLKYDGCPIPDTDGDGVNDEVDKCPTVAGMAKYNGCPIPDTDGDGINDEQDKCPNEKGVAQYNGCPVPDSDKDGIPDPEDKCPNIAGVKENEGCPAIPKFSASAIQFVTGKATLTPASLKELTEIVVYMNQYKEINLQIDGHTDNVGKAATNQVLSEKRAAAVKSALVKRGIEAERLMTSGYGFDKPVDDNTTAAGRSKNRRVEFHFSAK